MAGIDTDQEVDDYQASLTDLGGPDLVQFDGSDIRRLAPEIFDIILSELGWTEDELLGWNRLVGDTSLGSCGAMDVASLVAHFTVDAWDVQDQRRNLYRINLGVHHVFGELVVDLRGVPYAFPTDRERYKAISVLLPEWCALAAVGDPIQPLIEPNFDNRCQHVYRGLFYVGDVFEDHLRWALSTVFATPDVAMAARIPTDYYAGGSSLVMDYPDVYCNYSPDVIEGYARDGLVVLRDVRCDGACGTPAVSVSLSDSAVPNGEKVQPNTKPGKKKCGAEMFHPSNTEIDTCGGVLFQALRTDFYWYWATRLHHVAVMCDDPWAMLVAVIAARAGLSEIIATGATFVHEIGHHNANSHCGLDLACCQGAVSAYWQHSMLARFGCAQTSHDAVSDPLFYATSRYQSEHWASGLGGGRGCDPDIYSAVGRHCSLFRLQHAWQLTITYGTRWQMPSLDIPNESLGAGIHPFIDWPDNEVPRDACIPGDFGYPFVAALITLSDAGASCF